MRVLVMGAAVLDITAKPISNFEKWEQKQPIDSVDFFVGGDAANQCIRLADLGIEPAALSAIGDDRNGEIIKTALQSRGVDTRYLLKKGDYPTGTSLILLDKNGERTIFSVKGGAYASLNDGDVCGVSLSGIEAFSIASFFMEGSLESDGGMEKVLKRAKSAGILTFADVSHDKLSLGLDGIKRFLPDLDYFLPSLYDAQKMNGIRGAEANAEFYKSLGCRSVIIKCGAEGCYILSDEYTGWVRARKTKPIDTTGAGDCMVALFIAGIINKAGVERAARFACDGATLSTMYSGASAHKITAADIEEFTR